MGRSRGVQNSGDDEANQRSKRRRLASSGETLETTSSGSGANEGKKAQYHCNYCYKDISGKIRIKCAKCPDFDLCLECFSVCAEVTPHKSNHPYRVMDNLSFPLICADWNADEEILLLEATEMYGLGNWAEVAEHVGTKSKVQCIDHYTTTYMNSPCYPLPDMSRVNGKNRKELLAMAKVQGEGKRGTSLLGDMTIKEESSFSPAMVKIENLAGEASSGLLPLSLATGASKKVSNLGQLKDGSGISKLEGTVADRSIGIKKPKNSGDEGPLTEFSGYNPKRQEFDPEYDNDAEHSLAEMEFKESYNPKRQEFDPEYDNDAEQSLAEMEFKETDSETERELKLRVLHIYLSRLDERKRRKEFIVGRNLLFPSPWEKGLSVEDRKLYNRYKVFMRFLSQEDFKTLVESAIEERKIRRKIQELQACRAAGCWTLAEAKAYIDQKRKRELELTAQKAKETSQSLNSNKTAQKATRPLNKENGESDGSPRNTSCTNKFKGGLTLESGSRDSPTASVSQVCLRPFDEWDVTGLPGAELLSETDQIFCCKNRLLPSHYLNMQEVLLQEMFKGSIVKKSDAHSLFKVDPAKVDGIYDLVLKKLGQKEGSPAAS